MADHVDMSLDDIIKTNRPSGRGGRGRGRGGRSTRGGNQFNSGGGGGGAIRRQQRGGQRSTPYNRQNRDTSGAEGDVWQHDRYQDVASAVSRGRQGYRVGGGGTGGGNKLSLSNLHYEVSNEDIKELFSEFGELKAAVVQYDSSGRSLGTADVIFVRSQDAAVAMEKYNNVPLDGRPMHIEMSGGGRSQAASNNGASTGSVASRLGVRVESSNSWNKPRNTGAGGGGSRDRGSRGFSGRGGGRGRGGSAGGRGRTPRQQVSKEDLDAELEAYHNKMEQ